MTKPELIVCGPGSHNENMDARRAEIIEGGGWKKQRVIWLIPAGQQIDSKVYISHRGVMTPPNQPFLPMLCKGMEVGEAYNAGINQILSHPDLKDWEFILTVEHDNIPPPDGMIRLIRQMELHPELACIGGLYWTKGPMGVPQIWGDAKDPLLNFRPQPPVTNGLVECNGTGMGFNLWRLSMFKDASLRKPWFKTTCSAEEGVGTQDLYFWSDAKKYGYRCAIDCSVRVGHHDSAQDFTW